MDPKDFHATSAGLAIRTKAGYWAFIPAPLPPGLNWSLTLITALSEAERELSRLATRAEAFPFPQLLTQSFMRTEAVLSSRIEGTRASLVDLYAYETAQLSFFEPVEDAKEVYNYVRALGYGLQRLKSLPVSLRLIREIHGKLMENVRGGTLTPGEFRRSQNWIGPAGSTPSTAVYVPPPVDEMHESLNALEKFMHTRTELPALARLGMIHYQFEAIHPFLDGNGRTGRLLIGLLLYEWGLLPQPLLNLSAFFERYRQEYYDHLLAVSQHGAWEDWLKFFLRGINLQARASVTRMERLGEIRTKYQSIITAERNPNRMSRVVDFLFFRPIFTARQAEQELNIPFKTAQNYIEKLIQAGVARELTGRSRNRIYQADEILNALQSN